jgi:hypothetical protein
LTWCGGLLTLYAMKSVLTWSLLLTAASIIGCRDEKPPSGVIGEQKFVAAYALLLTETKPGEVKPDSVAALSRTSILLEQGISEEEFRTTLEWYNKNPERWREFYKQVTRHLEEQAATDTSTTVKRSAVQDSGWALRTVKLN